MCSARFWTTAQASSETRLGLLRAIAALTGAEADLAVAKLAIVVASMIAAVGSYCVLRFLARREG